MKHIAPAAVLLFIAGSGALAYARWSDPAADGDAALAAGRYEEALAHFAAAEARFERFGAVTALFAADYAHVTANELWVLHRLQRYDEVVDKAQRAPEGALPHFWSGSALFEKARAEEKPEPRLAWLTRAGRNSAARSKRLRTTGTRSVANDTRSSKGRTGRRGRNVMMRRRLPPLPPLLCVPPIIERRPPSASAPCRRTPAC
jgi:tetratricopeptide (TPR) repeat protein